MCIRDSFIADSVNDDEDAASALVAWLAGVHDIGKATPGFQYKGLERAELGEEMGLRVPRRDVYKRQAIPRCARRW